MTRIDFYTHVDDRPRLACVLCAKAVEQGLRVHVLTACEADSAALDELLWQIPPTAFLPHGRSDAEDADLLPVIVDHRPPPAGVDGLLVNLTDDCPAFFSRFERMAEIITLDETVAAAGRTRYREYRAQGYAIRTHAMAAGGAGDS